MRKILFSVAPLAVVALACSSSTPPRAEAEKPAQVASPIINGQNDTTHQAVVFVYAQAAGSNQGAACTGTVVKTDVANKIGWVLTAAHCVTSPPVLVIQGDDISSPSAIRYTVLDYAAHPSYDGNGNFDFAVVRFVGADAQTPVIPITGSPDGVTSGTAVTSVGYGTTVVPAQDNSVRHYANKSVSSTSSTQLQYGPSSVGNICFGDSGGPILYNNAVVGVHSYEIPGGGGQCTGGAGSSRVTSGLGFISPQLAKAAPAASCDLCMKTQESGNQTCAQKQQKCFGDAQCKGLYDCLTQCADATCQTNCLNKYPLGQGPLFAVSGCTCQTCNAQCATDTQCFNVPKCGFAVFGSSCRSCTDANCCNETLACSENGQCYQCLKTLDKDPACATNAQRKAMLSCQAKSCGTKCTSADGGAIVDPGATDDAGTDPGTTGDQPDGGAGSGGGGGGGSSSGCSAAPGAPSSGGAAALVALGLALAARRRRAR